MLISPEANCITVLISYPATLQREIRMVPKSSAIWLDPCLYAVEPWPFFFLRESWVYIFSQYPSKNSWVPQQMPN